MTPSPQHVLVMKRWPQGFCAVHYVLPQRYCGDQCYRHRVGMWLLQQAYNRYWAQWKDECAAIEQMSGAA